MKDDLQKLRNQIDKIDDEIVNLLSKRMVIIEKVGELKKEYQVLPLDEARLEEILNTKKKKAKILGISEDFIENLFKMIHDYSVKLQKKI